MLLCVNANWKKATASKLGMDLEQGLVWFGFEWKSITTELEVQEADSQTTKSRSVAFWGS